MPTKADQESMCIDVDALEGTGNGSLREAVFIGRAHDNGTWEHLPSAHPMHVVRSDEFDGYVDVSGVIDDEGDVDWFQFEAIDGHDGALAPTLWATVPLLSRPRIDICWYYEADATWDTEVRCIDGTRSAIAVPLVDDSEAVMHGCCVRYVERGKVRDVPSFSMEVNAVGTLNDSGTIYVAVTSPTKCLPYTISLSAKEGA
jgi:hypothetical protein